MDFTPTEDRRMLSETLTRFLADRYPIEHRNVVAYEPPWHDPALWAALADLGIFHAFAPEDRGGMGGSGFDIATVFEAIGAALCPEPVLGHLMAICLLSQTETDLDPLLSGEVPYAVAFNEPGDLYPCETVQTTGTTRLTGRKSVVYGGGSAARILVVTRDGISEIAAGDATLQSYGMIDGGPAAELFLDDTPATMVKAGLQPALDAACLALSAEAVGAMDRALALLCDYAQTREQFGRPIGSFQALQHRLVDLRIEVEQARSITILAADALHRSSREIAMAKALVGEVAQKVAEEVIQIHGGIAMTWEYPASHYAKRLVMIGHQLGDTDYHLGQVAKAYA